MGEIEDDAAHETAISVCETTNLALLDLDQRAREYIAAGVRQNTSKTYGSALSAYVSWCAEMGLQPIPASGETVVRYLTARAETLKVSSLNVALAAITAAHRETGHGADWSATDLPGVRAFMRGLRRKKAEDGETTEKKMYLTLEEIRRGLAGEDTTLTLRARALVLLGFFSALRRSELVLLRVSDVKQIPGGLQLLIRASKTDKDSRGQSVAVPALPDQPDLCPVRAFRAWVAHADRKGTDYVFCRLDDPKQPMQDRNVAEIVKQVAARAGLDPTQYAGHSLRRGFATAAGQVKAEERKIMQVTRHRSERMVREYIDDGQRIENHPGLQIAAALDKKETP
jgi:site-specific recombinase XerD